MIPIRPPNILWISFEDTSPNYGCYGDPVARTPNVDRLAQEGRLYKNAFATTAVCAPTRCAIITGMYAISIGAHHMRTSHTAREVPEMPTPYETVPPHYVKCFPEYLRAAGYFCTNNLKTDYQFRPPFTAWDEQGAHAHWRNRTDPSQPFFAVFNLEETHESGMWPEKCPNPTFDPDDVVVPPFLPDTPKVRESMARMYTHLENNDRKLGALLRQLEEDGLAENTVVFHWSDHGPLPRGKRWPYDSGLHVPLIIRWPGALEPGSVCDDLVSTIDLGPTVLSLCGLDLPTHLQGQAFLGPKARPARPVIFASRDRHDIAWDMVRAARDDRYKYIRNYCPEQSRLAWGPYRNTHPISEELYRLHLAGELPPEQSQLFDYPRAPEELYDTWMDPHELRNIAGDPESAPELERLSKAVDDWLSTVGDMGRIQESDMVRSWYRDGIQPTTSAPIFIPISEGHYGLKAASKEAAVQSPCLLQLHSGTQGASMGYRFADDPEESWRLYTTPFRLEPGSHAIQAKAIRIGYLPSDVSELKLSVASSSVHLLKVTTGSPS